MPAGTNYCISEGMLGKQFIELDRDRDGVTDHVAIPVFNQFLHPNHPLGWIRKLDVAIDGKSVPPERMAFVVRDQWIAFEHLASITDIWWYMHEEARIVIKGPPIPAGEHQVTCTFAVSLHVHTPNIDRDDCWPSLEQTITATLIAGTL
ncbi:C-glycoside deglycosidase beta subunit domain-containing protein [Pleomorphomonas carboxyditropha]|nr:DUF6379 domain-containing protein [Pleomorphomonas carboxyditropha]